MEIVSFLEFRDYVEKKNPTVIIYDDGNNSNYIRGAKRRCYSITEPLRMDLTFDSVLMLMNPNIVLLKSNSGTMRFNFVRKISIDNDCLLGDVVTLFCTTEDGTTAYTLIIR